MSSPEATEKTNANGVDDQNKKAAAAASAFGRSVIDYVTTEELHQALQTVTPPAGAVVGTASSTATTAAAAASKPAADKTSTSNASDWKLPIPDANCEEQTTETELQRLLTLKSYMLLDAEKEQEFDKLTQEAREVFGVPTSLISLIDLGRQFLFSNTGADVRETTRAVAFCSYTILNKKDDVTVVPDASQDFRFKDGELVQGGPKLRFYAGAPLISPEGYKLGTFCVEGPVPRPQGLTAEEQTKLQEYAAKTMELMVDRRKRLRDRLSCQSVSQELRQHACVATSLGDILYVDKGDMVTAMRLYQESVQTIMYVDSSSASSSAGSNSSPTQQQGMVKPPAERQTAMAQLLTLLSVDGIPEKTKDELMDKVVALYEQQPAKSTTTKAHSDGGIAGLFHVPSKLKGSAPNTQKPLPGLFFNEVFKIDMRGLLPGLPNDSDTRPLEEVPFTVPPEECSKATLFNMGLIHYHAFGNAETAMQFFHLAASVSHKISPLEFDPIDISCINNMAQIHLQYGQSDDAMKMLTETLERGNRALAAIYRQTETDHHETAAAKATSGKSEEDEMMDDDDDDEITDEMQERDIFRTFRLRRKLARTLINIAHVHFFNGNYKDAMASLLDAIPILDDKAMTGRTLATIWYNMSMVFYHQGGSKENLQQALTHMDKFLDLAKKLNGPDHLQNADVLYRKALILVDMGNAQAAMEAIEESLRIRKIHNGDDVNQASVDEALGLKGKILLSRKEYDAALQSLNTCLDIQRKQLNGGDLTFELAQTLLDIGQALHAKGQVDESLEKYKEVLAWTRKFFGANHPFVARVDGIIGNIYVESGKMEESKPFLDEAAKIQQELQNTSIAATS